MKINRRDFVKLGAATGVAASIPGWTRSGRAEPAAGGLSDPAVQPKFVNTVPNALDPGFLFKTDDQGRYRVRAGRGIQYTGLRKNGSGRLLPTRIFGYADQSQGRMPVTWPGMTIQTKSRSAGGPDRTTVVWKNTLRHSHPLPVDTSLHWCYSLKGESSRNGHDYSQYSIEENGVPMITHLHGGHSDFQFDGNPEFFHSHRNEVRGPQWDFAPGGFTNRFRYDNDVPAGNLWYHDHALGLTRLNVYAGLAGFYFVRDKWDTGTFQSPLGLPAFPYEMALAIQDRMFTKRGSLFYSAFPGDPFYDDFITGEGAVLPPELFPGGGPTALAEFFGDHMVVNGKIWPKADVEPRHYRLRLLNGTDSRFMVVRFRVARDRYATDLEGASEPLPFYVIGSDQGLASRATETDTLVFEPGARYDVVFDFSQVRYGDRVIMENIGGDAPFGGDFGDALAPEDFFPDRQTDRIMAFDVTRDRNRKIPDRFRPHRIRNDVGNHKAVDRVRKVALFEGKDEFGRLQPLLGTAEPTVDAAGNTVNGALTWHNPTTEMPHLGDTEIWEIYNATGDAHPVHLHLVNFEVLDRRSFTADAIEQPVHQHNGSTGIGFRLENISVGAEVDPGPGYVEDTPKDMVTALPEQVTRIKTTFDKRGRYVWHCHILSHEDHEMMRVLEVI